MADIAEQLSARGGCATSVGSTPAEAHRGPRQLLTLTARFGHAGRHGELVYAASDTSLEDLGDLLSRASGCESDIFAFGANPVRLWRAPHAEGRLRARLPG
jgi:hypothetical protein